MKAKMYPKFCVDCKWSEPNPGIILLKCKHPLVCNINSFILGTIGKNYERVFCDIERGKKWFGQCGRKGKLWEKKENEEKYVEKSVFEDIRYESCPSSEENRQEDCRKSINKQTC